MRPAAELCALGRAAGLDAVGIAGAEPFVQARAALLDRRASGLAAGMAFTFRNPERSTTPEATLAGARALVVGARRYAGAGADPAPPGGAHGRVARYARDDSYAVLRAALEAVARPLRADGWRAVVLADQNHLVDRAAAHRAGLGWYGKSSNLLLPGEGSWFVLGAVLTDVPLEPTAERPVGDGCGSCRRCLDGCPTGAIVAPGVVDARRCLAWLVQSPDVFPRSLRRALGDRLYGCDDCQEVCPPNRRPSLTADPPSESAAWVDLLELLAADDDALLARFGRWYVPRRDPRYLRRTALVVLGNTGDGSDPRVRATLVRYLTHDDPFLRAHAVWAAAALGLAELAAAAADDPDPQVREEWAAVAEGAA